MPKYRVTYEERIVREILVTARSKSGAKELVLCGGVTNCDEDKVISEEHCNVTDIELIS